MNVLDYIRDTLPDIKLIIFSSLPAELLSACKIQQSISEIIFKLRYPIYYLEVKNIIKINRELDFDKYTEDGSYFWNILLNDELKSDIRGGGMTMIDEGSWRSYNIISLDIKNMIRLYNYCPKFYKYVNKLLEYPYEILLLSGAVVSVECGLVECSQVLKDVLTTGDIKRVEITFTKSCDFELIILANFMKKIIPESYFIYPIDEILHMIDSMENDGDNWNDNSVITHCNIVNIYLKALKISSI